MSGRSLASLLTLSALLLSPKLLHAQGTHVWTESSTADWEKGMPKGVAIGSDGMLSPGFVADTVARLEASDVWALASDTHGNAYVATGSPAQVVRIGADGKQTVIFATKDLSVQSLAIGPDGMVYAATLPSARVFRIDPATTRPLDEHSAKVVFDATTTTENPHYLWAMLFDASGQLYIGTGAPGAIFRVNPGRPGAQPELFFAADEPHIRSMLFLPGGDLLAGSDGTGLVYRITPAGKGVVLYEAQKREITALAMGQHGEVYLAAVGEKGRVNTLPPLPTSGAGTAANASITVTVVQPGSTQAVNTNSAIPDGSEVDRLPLGTTEAPSRVWAAHEDVVYALRSTPDGLLAATGNRGRIYRLLPDGRVQDMAHADAGEVIDFADAGGGALFLAAANSGKLLRMSLKPATEGTLLSDVFDASEPSLWGHAEVTGDASGSTLETRFGNIDNPARGWGDWSPAGAAQTGTARFAQWRLSLHGGAQVSQVALPYLPENAAPEVDEVLVAPGTRVNAQAMQVSYPQQTPLTFASQGGNAVNIDNNSPAAPLSAIRDKGSITVRWAAHDDNGDELRFSIFYRGANDGEWRLLKRDLSDRYYSFDASLLPDGPYRLRVVATDAPSHPAGQALTGERVSDLFLVDTATPSVAPLTARRVGDALHVTATATGTKTPIARAEYSVDAGPWQYVEPVGRVSDAIREQYDFSAPVPAETAGQPHVVTLRVFDRYDNSGTAKVSVP